MESDNESEIFDGRDPDKARVACLCSIEDLQKKCQKAELKFTEETNRYMVYLTLRKLGPHTAKKLIKKLVERGEFAWDKEEDFEVEAIIDHGMDDNDNDMYFIKWKGWAHSHNSWEPKKNLTDCSELLEEFHVRNNCLMNKKDLRKHYAEQQMVKADAVSGKAQIDDIFARISESNPSITPLQLLSLQSPVKRQSINRTKRLLRPVKRSLNISNKRSKAYKVLKEEQQKALKQWENSLNNINSDPARIYVENKIDLEGPPDKFIFTNDCKEGPDITIPQDPIIGCECTDCFSEKKTCCATNAGSEFAYYKSGKVRVPPGTPIYECNKRCRCGPTCDNRVVQHGRRHRVCIFRTSNNRGWGVKAMQAIKKGSFVMEYVGEVISNEEAERRGREYDAECRTYLFDLDYNDGDCPFTVDAGIIGNVSHFVNHSCDPNLTVYGVWINTLDPRLPRICLFAKKDIKIGEEMTFDYMMTGDTTQSIAQQPLPDITEVSQESITMVTSQQSVLSDSAVYDSLTPIKNKENITPNIDQVNSDRQSPDKVVCEDSVTESVEVGDDLGDISGSQLPVSSPFFKRKITSPSPAMKYRIICQCGSANCRKYLF